MLKNATPFTPVFTDRWRCQTEILINSQYRLIFVQTYIKMKVLFWPIRKCKNPVEKCRFPVSRGRLVRNYFRAARKIFARLENPRKITGCKQALLWISLRARSPIGSENRSCTWTLHVHVHVHGDNIMYRNGGRVHTADH
jgi:hypothetical protein